MSTTTTTTHSSSPETLWQDGLSETGDSRAQRGRPDWTDLVFFLLLSAGAGYAHAPWRRHGLLREDHPLRHRAGAGLAGLAVACCAA